VRVDHLHRIALRPQRGQFRPARIGRGVTPRPDEAQPRRQRGITKNNFYTLYDIAMLGITNHSKVPLRLMVMGGGLLAGLSLLAAFGFLLAKLVFWNSFQMGIAPLLISLFFFSSVQILFLGMLGEYLGSVHTQMRNMPLVVEAERVNFD
jgi:hypothetical protein